MNSIWAILLNLGIIFLVLWVCGYAVARPLNMQGKYVGWTKRLLRFFFRRAIARPARSIWLRHKVRITWLIIGAIIAFAIIAYNSQTFQPPSP